MIAYTSALLAAANLLALAHAAPAQPVCSVVTTVITGSPIWVPRADPTTWGPWPPKVTTTSTTTTSSSKGWWTTDYSTSFAMGLSTSTSTSSPGWSTTSYSTSFAMGLSTSTSTPSTTSSAAATTSSAAATTTTPAPAPTCAATGNAVFSAGASGSCGCEFTVNCNMHSPYTANTQFWERQTGEIIDSLQDCLNICNDNSACTAVVWSNQSGESSNDYMRCWQTSGLPQPDSTGYGQLSYKGSCSSSCAQNYNTSPSS